MQLSVVGRWSYLKQLIAETSGGLDRIVLIRGSQKFRLSLWCSVYVALTAFMINLCLDAVKAYCAFPTVISIDISEDNLSVPSIALCSFNPFKRRKLCEEPFASLCDPDLDFVSAFSELLAGSDTGNASAEFIERYKQAFINLRDLVVSCSLRGVSCGSGFFAPTIVELSRFGQCFCMFCEGNRKYAEAFRYRTQTPEEGLVLELNSSTREYLPHIKDLGFVFFFYTYRKSAMVTRDSVHASLGESTYMRLETTEMKLLPAPYPSQCGSDWPPGYETIAGIDEEQYSFSRCMAICLSQQAMRECNCEITNEFSQLSVIENVCTRSRAELKCRNKALSSPKRFRANCECSDECRVNIYRVQTSSGGFRKTRRRASPDRTRVTIYQSGSENTLIRERAKYRFSEMIAALGSNMNTFIGLSFLAIYEVFDVLAAWFSFLAERTRSL
ncbi:acid-sensing ion channel 4-B-like [Galendromus occidentalis]|uniref:Acid-sensing ion channel 4-B-like n=1 Tax=Galendromus occidentalis TaxID=34638 RepID=A0AAJ6QQ71_9ACAR|nr:acid-sensing ion channel 4-B-like [Galendromus occidentalis]